MYSAPGLQSVCEWVGNPKATKATTRRKVEAHAHPSRSRNHFVSPPQVHVPIEAYVPAAIAAVFAARPWVICSQVVMLFFQCVRPQHQIGADSIRLCNAGVYLG